MTDLSTGSLSPRLGSTYRPIAKVLHLLHPESDVGYSLGGPSVHVGARRVTATTGRPSKLWGIAESPWGKHIYEWEYWGAWNLNLLRFKLAYELLPISWLLSALFMTWLRTGVLFEGGSITWREALPYAALVLAHVVLHWVWVFLAAVWYHEGARRAVFILARWFIVGAGAYLMAYFLKAAFPTNPFISWFGR